MRARLRRFVDDVANAFWVLPALIVAGLSGLALAAVEVQLLAPLPGWARTDWIYGGGDTGARTLLGAIASSTIGVAGTLFSITIAALTLASSQMGPRLLRNFMRDRGNQVTLGVLLGTFAYALLVLRSVRGGEDEAFVPALGVTVGLGLAGVCIALLIYFIHHVANRINVDTVIDLVHDDVLEGVGRLTLAEPDPVPEDPVDWDRAGPIRLPHSGHLQQMDAEALADWADENDCVLRFLKRPGEYVYPFAPIALISRPVEAAQEAIWSRIALSRQGGAPDDFTFPIAQLVEVAVRALSPGINDPRTAISVLNRLGAALAELSTRHFRSGASLRSGVVRLWAPPLRYADVVSAMFEMIRQNAGGSPAVPLHMLEILTEVVRIEHDLQRRGVLRNQARVAFDQGLALFDNPFDRARLQSAHAAFLRAAGSSG